MISVGPHVRKIQKLPDRTGLFADPFQGFYQLVIYRLILTKLWFTRGQSSGGLLLSDSWKWVCCFLRWTQAANICTKYMYVIASISKVSISPSILFFFIDNMVLCLNPLVLKCKQKWINQGLNSWIMCLYQSVDLWMPLLWSVQLF